MYILHLRLVKLDLVDLDQVLVEQDMLSRVLTLSVEHKEKVVKQVVFLVASLLVALGESVVLNHKQL